MARCAKRAMRIIDDSSETELDEPVPVAKKPKNSTGSEEHTWNLDDKYQLRVRTVRGMVQLDIRRYKRKKGQLKVDRKGISLSADQWRQLQILIPDVNEAFNATKSKKAK